MAKRSSDLVVVVVFPSVTTRAKFVGGVVRRSPDLVDVVYPPLVTTVLQFGEGNVLW